MRCGYGLPTPSEALPSQSAELVEAALNDGRYLDCSSMMMYSGERYTRYILDCDWNHPRTASNAALRSVGKFNVVLKRFQDGRVLNCINFDVYRRAVENCDWTHPVIPANAA